MTQPLTPAVRREAVAFTVFAVAAAAAAAFVWFGLPHDREVKSLGVFLLKLVPFICATEAIAWLPTRWVRSTTLKLVLVVLAFCGYFLYFVPRLFFYSDDFPTFYYYMLTMTPVLILSLALAYRLGGGAGAGARRIGYASILVMLSGLEDLSFLTTTPGQGPIPQVWTWASHMTVFVGRPLHKAEAFVFIAIHVVLAVAVLTVPTRWLRRSRTPTPADPAPADPAPAGPTAGKAAEPADVGSSR